MRYRLRTLLILLALGPPLLGWWAWPIAKSQYDAWRREKAARLARATLQVAPPVGGLQLLLKEKVPVSEGGGLIELPVDK